MSRDFDICLLTNYVEDGHNNDIIFDLTSTRIPVTSNRKGGIINPNKFHFILKKIHLHVLCIT